MESDIDRLFHFTKTVENLENILKGREFWVSFCVEDHRFLNKADEFRILYEGDDNKLIKNLVAYPMVCFCDIPLERIEAHTLNYGKFGIGMRRDWVKKNNISPVQYIGEDSFSARLWLDILKNIGQVQSFIKKEDRVYVESYFNNLIHLASYIKPYRNNTAIFYNEREWRYYPPTDPWGENKRRFLIKNDQVDEIHEYEKENGNKKSAYKLLFNYEDVDCLIVPDEGSKDRLLDVISDLKISKLSVEIKVLSNS